MNNIYWIIGSQKISSHGRQFRVPYKVQPNGRNVEMHIRYVPELKELFSQYGYAHMGDGAFVVPVGFLGTDGNQFLEINYFGLLTDDEPCMIDLREYGVRFFVSIDFADQNGWLD